MTAPLSRTAFAPDKVYVERVVAQTPRAKSILHNVGTPEVVLIDDYRKIEVHAQGQADHFIRAKRHLAIAAKKGEPVKEFRRHSRLKQAREYYLVHAAGCPFDCSYCYLQSYFQNPVPTIFVNTGALFEQVEEIAKGATAGGDILFHAGETADALALEHLSGFAADAVDFFSGLDSATLELRTKSANVDSILPLAHGGRTVVSWTLTPHAIADEYERGAASIETRLAAASDCAGAGYPVGLRLDPVIHFDGWRRAYRRLLEEISQSLSPQAIHSIVLGCFRFPPRLREVMIDRFGRDRLVLGQFLPSPDGKMRYFRHIREEMYREILRLIREFLGEQCAKKTALSMEPEYVWCNLGLLND